MIRDVTISVKFLRHWASTPALLTSTWRICFLIPGLVCITVSCSLLIRFHARAGRRRWKGVFTVLASVMLPTDCVRARIDQRLYCSQQFTCTGRSISPNILQSDICTYLLGNEAFCSAVCGIVWSWLSGHCTTLMQNSSKMLAANEGAWISKCSELYCMNAKTSKIRQYRRKMMDSHHRFSTEISIFQKLVYNGCLHFQLYFIIISLQSLLLFGNQIPGCLCERNYGTTEYLSPFRASSIGRIVIF